MRDMGAAEFRDDGTVDVGAAASAGADPEPRLRVSERHAAENILNRHYADPDDDPAIVARAALRLGAQGGPSLDVERLALALHDDGIGCAIACRPFSDGGGQYVRCFGPDYHRWQAESLAARLGVAPEPPE